MKQIAVASLGAILGVLMAFSGITAVDKDTYFCGSKQLLMQCSRVSSSEVRCYPSLTTTQGYKDCSEGWAKVVNETYTIPISNSSVVAVCIANECMTPDQYKARFNFTT